MWTPQGQASFSVCLSVYAMSGIMIDGRVLLPEPTPQIAGGSSSVCLRVRSAMCGTESHMVLSGGGVPECSSGHQMTQVSGYGPAVARRKCGYWSLVS